MKYVFATGNFVFHVWMKNKVNSVKGTWAGGEQGVQFLRDSFAFLFMAKKNMTIWRWQEENAVEVEELE